MARPKAKLAELGTSGLMLHAGIEIKDTPEIQLRSPYSRYKCYRKMELDPTISGTLQAFLNISGMVSWKENAMPFPSDILPPEPVDFDDNEAAYEKALKAHAKVVREFEVEAAKHKKFLEECALDNAQSWHDIAEAALDMLVIGHQVTVPQYKIRKGDSTNPKYRSKFNDLKYGWRSWKVIDQLTIDRWITPNSEGYSSLTGIEQRTSGGSKITIPRDRLLLFRTTTTGDSPSGSSILYGAFTTHSNKERVKKIEVVSLERNLEGIPKATIPMSYLTKDAGDNEKQMVQYLTQIVKHIKYNEQTGLILPSDTDDKGNKLIDIELMTSGSNSRLDACRKVITDEEKLMAESLLAGFIKLGGAQGSNALSTDMTEMFILAMRTYLNKIKSVINEEAIPELWRLNDLDPKYMPSIDFRGLEKDTVSQFVDNLVKAINANAVIPTALTQDAVLDKLELSKEGASDAWAKRKNEESDDKELNARSVEATIKATEAPPTPKGDK